MKKQTLKIVLLLSLFAVIVNSCKKSNKVTPFPTSADQITAAVATTQQIAIDSRKIIDQTIDDAVANNTTFNVSDIASKIKSLKGVKSATATPSGAGIVVEQTDGTTINLIVVRKDDSRLFQETDNKILSIDIAAIKKALDAHTPILPTGRKALILAPFHSSFNENLDLLANILNKAGYTTDVYENADANIDKFRGSFLENYDIVYISTHGLANSHTLDNTPSSTILTGEVYSEARLILLPENEQKLIGAGSPGNETYFSLSTPWLGLTSSGKFHNSWIFIDACESTKGTDLYSKFLSLGGTGYNGYKETVNANLSNSIATKATAIFASATEFNAMHDSVTADKGLKEKAWTLRSSGPSANVALFDAKKNITQPFYIVSPDSVVGTAMVVPSSGPVGTGVVYKVTIKPKFAAKVASVSFDIDNTGEHLDANQVTDSLWTRDGLTAPTANTYPRIDTFTFTAYDANGKSLGSGFATFSILTGDNSVIKRQISSTYQTHKIQ